jgi:hypothetical protein
MAHRLNTVLTDAVKVVESDDESFLLFNEAVRDLIAYVHRSDLSQDKLPVTLKKYSGTRPWRSFFFVHNAIVKSYEVLREMLEQRNETHRIVKISPQICQEISKFFASFNAIFDYLECGSEATLQNVLPSFYLIRDTHCVASPEDLPIIAKLKIRVKELMEKKYWTSINTMHMMACVLDPGFKTLQFVPEKKDRQQYLKDVRTNLILLSKELPEEAESIDLIKSSPPKKVCISSSNPFAAMRVAQHSATNNSTSADKLSVSDRVTIQFEQYLESANCEAVENPLKFWASTDSKMPDLARLARRILVIQASSGESERHFSIAGNITTPQRSLLSPDVVETLVVLKEASNNNLW